MLTLSPWIEIQGYFPMSTKVDNHNRQPQNSFWGQRGRRSSE